MFLGAWLVLLFEVHAAGSNIHNYGNALWWAIVTVTTVGYGDRYPLTPGGRIVATVLMLVGIGLIGVLTATVASVFVQEHAQANHDEIKKTHADFGLLASTASATGSTTWNAGWAPRPRSWRPSTPRPRPRLTVR